MQTIHPGSTVDNRRRRIRSVGLHRGWTAAQRTTEAIAADIAQSIQDHEEAGHYGWIPEMYTDDQDIIDFAYYLLDR